MALSDEEKMEEMQKIPSEQSSSSFFSPPSSSLPALSERNYAKCVGMTCKLFTCGLISSVIGATIIAIFWYYFHPQDTNQSTYQSGPGGPG